MALKFLLWVFFLGLAIGIALHIIFFSPISPDFLQLPTTSSVFIPPNNKLQEVIKLGEGLTKPEDVAVDENGLLYTATRDGWIKRMHRNGSWESWKELHTATLLGICKAKGGGLIVCDCDKGLLKVTEEGVTVLASHVAGSQIRTKHLLGELQHHNGLFFPYGKHKAYQNQNTALGAAEAVKAYIDDAIEASDGSIYFSVASTKFGLHNWYLDVLEAKPHGQLLKYDPATEETSIVLDGLGFGNGVALSKDEDYLIVCETWRFRCLKYWLKEEKKGQTDIFIENLPGGPDNINLAPDGSFWIALVQIVKKGTEFLHTSKVLKNIVAYSSTLTSLMNPSQERATVINVDADGNVINRFDDPNGKAISFVTSALEFEDNLYLGSLNAHSVGKLPLK